MMGVDADRLDPGRITVEPWTVYRAAHGDEVRRWALCFDGTPILTCESRAEAEARARTWGTEAPTEREAD